jgi:hypothetical protein
VQIQETIDLILQALNRLPKQLHVAPGARVDRPTLPLGVGHMIAVEEVVDPLQNRQRTPEFVHRMSEELPLLLQDARSIVPRIASTRLEVFRDRIATALAGSLIEASFLGAMPRELAVRVGRAPEGGGIHENKSTLERGGMRRDEISNGSLAADQ